MGCGVFSTASYATYSKSVGKLYDVSTGRISGQDFKSRSIDDSLNPQNFILRECVNNDEHPNTIPVILALDVTGSMGSACNETAEALGVIITNLYEKFKDVEFCIMGIGDLDYDNAPIQMSQFESDVRISVALDKIYMEHGGGGNAFESYTAAWYMGLNKTKLDCFDKQGRKGIIITMGDEPLNPYLPATTLNKWTGLTEQEDIETNTLYNKVKEKFDIYHIAVDSTKNCYGRYKKEIEKTFGQLLGNNLKVSTINNLATTIEDCISESVGSVESISTGTVLLNENNEISW